MSKRGWLLFAALGVVWGMPYLLIRVAVASLSPAVVVTGRMTLAIALLLPMALRDHLPTVWRTHWRAVVAFACAEMVFPFGALAVAEQHITSSLTGLLIAAVPLVTALMLRMTGHADQWDARRVAGLVLGWIGVASLVGIDVRADTWWAIALCFVAVLGYAMGPLIISTQMSNAPQLAVLTLAQATAVVMYLPFLIHDVMTGSWNRTSGQSVPTTAWLAVALLGAVCTALAFTLLFKLIDEVGPGRTTVITYINPAVAIVLGVLILDEPFTTGLAVGFPLVLAGSVLATRRNANTNA